MTQTPIAIIGMACRFPGGENLQTFWDLLIDGRDGLSEIPPERIELPPEFPARAGLLSRPLAFDADWFKLTAREAESMDPQQRLLLELSVEALRDAGLHPRMLEAQPIGVFIGVSSQDYLQTRLQSPEQVNMYTITGSAASVIANRLSYQFDWRGPSLVVDTACSSALSAVHLALHSLATGHSELALAGGVNLLLSGLIYQGFAEAQVLSPQGRIAAFAENADGIVRGEGGGLVVLKPLPRALADGDRIYAVIRGSGLGQDGQTNGLSAPSPGGQKRTLQSALQASGLEAESVDYVETHGTGTPLGDPIEARALAEVYACKRREAGLPPLAIGSVKTNLGHLEAAAGIAGLIKAALSLWQGQLPPSLNCEQPNSRIPWQQWHLEVLRSPRPLSGPTARLGVSAFGFGGTNVHVLLESPPRSRQQTPRAAAGILPLSAPGSRSLVQIATRLAQALRSQPELQAEDLSWSAARLEPGPFRQALVWSDRNQLIQALDKLSTEAPLAYPLLPPARRRLVFLFSGHGSQEPGMGQNLLAEPVFAEKMAEIAHVLDPLTGFSLLQALQAPTSTHPTVIQPLLFAIQLGIVALLESWGLQADALLGTSMGEISAACVGGWLSLADACQILVRRIGLIASTLGTGGMAVIGLSAQELSDWLKADQPVWIAGLNGPEMTVVAGQEQALGELLQRLQAAGHFARRIAGADAPSHCPLMQPLREPLLKALEGIQPRPGKIPLWSTVLPDTTPHQDFSAEYWWQNLCQPVQLLPVFQQALERGEQVFLEISPHPVLLNALQGAAAGQPFEPILLSSLHRGLQDSLQLRETVAKLWNLGFTPDWQRLLTPGQRVSLPWAWEHQDYDLAATAEQGSAPLARRIGKAFPSKTRATAPAEAIQEQLQGLPRPDQQARLLAWLQQELGQALRLSPQSLNPDEPLQHLGIGSLVGMELFSRLKKHFQLQLPLSEFLKGPSLRQLTDRILDSLNPVPASPRPSRPEILPLSYAQQRFWLLEQLQPGQLLIPVAVRLEGPLQEELLQAALNRVVERHEILRTLYLSTSGTDPHQVILPPQPAAWESADLRALPSQVQHEQLRSFAKRPFAWESQPPLRAGLFRISDQAWVWVLGLHHIAADGLSFRVLYQELKQIYEALQAGREPVLPELEWQYADYALWQRTQQNEAQAEALSFWQKALENAPPRLLPPLMDGDSEQPRGCHHLFDWGPEAVNRLESEARQAGVSLFSLLLASWRVMLWRLSGVTDLVIGTPVAGRLQSETLNLIGPFLNMLPLRQQLNPELSWRDWLSAVDQSVREALDHQELPFEHLVEKLAPPRIPGVHPLFQTVLALHGEIALEPLGACQVSSLELDIGISRYDLAVTLIPEAGSLHGRVEFNPDRYPPALVKVLIQAWQSWLEQLAHTPPDLPLKRRGWPETCWRGPALSGPPRRLQDLLAPPGPETAILDCRIPGETHRWSYQALWERASALSQHLSAQTHPQQPVATLLEASPELVISWLACLLSGRPYLPLDPDSPPERLLRQLASLDQPLLLTRQPLPYSGCQWDPTAVLESAPVPAAANPALTPEALACLIMTSGSSGPPKAVCVTHAGLSLLVQWHLARFPTAAGEIIPQTAQVSFDAAGWEIWSTLAAGATLLLLPRSTLLDPQALARQLEVSQVRQLFLPTPLAEAFMQQSFPEDFPLRCLRTGGDRLHAAPPADLPFALWNHYGPTECSVVSSAGLIPPGSSQLPDLGQLLPGFTAWIRDPEGLSLPEGFPGELCLGGPALATGYWQDPELSAQRFETLPQRIYHTGDQMRILEGRLHFLGRSDRQFKRHGVRLEAGELEALLMQLPGVQQAVIDWDADRGILSACLIGDPTMDPKSHCQQLLPPSHRPDQWIWLERLPLSGRDKLDYQAIAALCRSHRQAALPAPQLDSSLLAQERELLALWQEVLPPLSQDGPLGAECSFFEAGGHSLLALKLQDLIRRRLGKEVSLAELFKHPQLGSQARLIATAPQAHWQWPMLIPERAGKHQTYPMTPVQEAYWLGSQAGFSLGGIAPRAVLELELPRITATALEQALRTLLQRHPHLLAQITVEGLWQIPDPLPPWHLHWEDLRSWSAAAREARRLELREALRQDSQIPHLGVSGLQEEDRCWLLLSLDALLADARSYLLLSEELQRLLQGETLEPLEISFRDYVLTRQALLDSPPGRAARAYWSQRLAELPDAPPLPLARHPEQVSQPRFNRLSLHMPYLPWQALKQEGVRLGLSPNALVLSLFAAVLARWSAPAPFLLNLTTFERLPLHPQIGKLVGDFTTLTLLAIPAAQGSLADWARAIQDQLSADLEHSLWGGVEILRELRRQGRELQAPVVFTGLLGQELPTLPLGARLSFAQTQTPQVWLDCQAAEDSKGLHLHWDYVEELFPTGMLPAAFAALENLLQQLAQNPQGWRAPVSTQIPLDPAQQAAREQANATEQEITPQLLHAGFFQQALQHPEAPALISPERSLSYAELAAQADGLAQELLERGLVPGEPVAILMPKGWQQAVAVLGILLAGGAYLPVEAELPPARQQALLRLGQVRTVVCLPGTEPPPGEWTGLPLSEEGGTLPPRTELLEKQLAQVSPSSLAYLLFTSGSSGEPKGVMISHAAAWNTIAALNQELQLQPEDRLLGLSSLSFDLSVYDCFGTWAAGACLVLPPAASARRPDRWLPLIHSYGITLWNSVPALMGLLLEYLQGQPQQTLPSLRAVLLSGDWIPLQMPERIRHIAPHCRILALGGATEAAIWSNCWEYQGELVDWPSIPYGYPLANQRFCVRNSTGQVCPDWVPGELWIGGQGLALGYWRDPELTAQRFVRESETGLRWYRTGDRGRYRPGGILEFLGREDQQVKIQGHRIELGEIEARLRAHPDLQEALVHAPGERERRVLVACILPHTGRAAPEPESLQAWLAETLPEWMIPRQWQVLTELPLNANGKPDRRRLPGGLPQQQPPEWPLSEEVQRLQRLFSEVMDLPAPHPDTDLLSLGLHSIDLIRLANRLQTEFGFAPGVGELFQLRSLGQLAGYYAQSAPAVLSTGRRLEPEQDRRTLGTTVSLPEDGSSWAWGWEHWRSTRQFAARPVTAHALGTLLAPLRSGGSPTQIRYLYPSAGGVYALAVYLQVTAGGFADLPAGLWHWRAETGVLQALTREGPALTELHLPPSLEMAKSAAFSLYLVADLERLAAHYGADARDYALIESGCMAQLLRQSAAQAGLGLCAVGRVNAALLQAAFQWHPGQELLHTLVGGWPVSASPVETEQENWEEWSF